jgi:hypothetical protein
MIQDEMRNAVHRSIESGKNPAEVIYKMSLKSGFKAKNTESGKIDSLKKAETASRSLTDTSGKSKTELSAESIAEMSDEDFMNLSDDQFRKAMGG